MQTILAVSIENLDNLAKIVDKISVVPFRNNIFIQSIQKNTSLEQQVAYLTQ